MLYNQPVVYYFLSEEIYLNNLAENIVCNAIARLQKD